MSDPASEVSTALALYPALADGDRVALDALLAPAFLGRTTAGLPLGLGGEYAGAAAMRREFWGRIAKHYDLRAEPAEAQSTGGGRVVVRGTYRGLARSTGRKFSAEFVHLLTVSGGRIASLEQITGSGSPEVVKAMRAFLQRRPARPDKGLADE